MPIREKPLKASIELIRFFGVIAMSCFMVYLVYAANIGLEGFNTLYILSIKGKNSVILILYTFCKYPKSRNTAKSRQEKGGFLTLSI
jgi:hypothetical protein